MLQLSRAQRSPQFWNHYTYAASNPLRYADPTGKVAIISGTEEEKKKTLAALKNTVPVNLRMFIRTTTDEKGQTVLDTRYLRMTGGRSASANFQSINTVAQSKEAFVISTSSMTIETSEGSIALEQGALGIFLERGGLSPSKEASFVHVAAGLTQLETSRSVAHEMRHASLFAQGLPYEHETTGEMVEVSPGVFEVRLHGPVNRATVAAEREAEVNFDPFYSHQ